MDKTTLSLFGETELSQTEREELCAGAVVLRGFALSDAIAIFEVLRNIISVAPFRYMMTPGGLRMSVAMTSCGS